MIEAYDLQTEYLTDPLGIDMQYPSFTWKVIGAELQKAYQIIAEREGQVIYDSGKIYSEKMRHKYPYLLSSREAVAWKIRLWDEREVVGKWSKRARFEMGLLEECEWKGEWINPEQNLNPKERQPASFLRKDFKVEDTKKARLYATAHGIYTISLNGVRIKDFILAPGTSQYEKRLQYQVYDVSKLLLVGINRIEVSLGDGWWRGDNGYEGQRNLYGKDIAFLCQLEIDKKIVLLSDGSWIATQEGPIRQNDLMQGETYDARKENISSWHSVKEEKFGYKNLVASNSVPVVEKERFKGKLIRTPSGESVLDFGQNIAGYVSFSVYARAGQKIILQHGECLDKEGNFTVENFQAPRHRVEQKIEYICKDGKNVYSPTKAVFGFRYVRICTDVKFQQEDFTAIAVYSDMRQVGWFVCGHEGINRLFENTVWSMKGNFLEVPTDCPTRERTGFTGDAQVFVNTGLYLMDCYPVFRKFLEELRSGDDEEGCVSQTAPAVGETRYDGSAGWSDAIDLIPYRMFLRFGDPRILEENYERTKQWIAFCLKRAEKDNPGRKKKRAEQYSRYILDTGSHWGEWLEPNLNGFDSVSEYLQDIRDHGAAENCTSHLSYGCMIAAMMAKELGYTKEQAYYENLRQKTKKGYREACTDDGRIVSKRQCEYVRAIMFDMLSESEKKIVAKQLNELVKEDNYHIGTGFLTTFELLRVLTDYGYSDTAYNLLLQEEIPGWLYQLKFDATTIWEKWDAIQKEKNPSGSLNHYALGTFSGWLMDRVAGIVLKDGEIIIHPYPDKRLGFVDAKYDSPIGVIQSSWKYDRDRFSLRVSIPANTKAKIILPDGREYIIKSGQYKYEEKA